jgi:hypothetical protein
MLTITTNRDIARTQGDLAALQQALCNTAAADPLLAPYTWLYEQKQDVVAAIREANAKVGGWCLVLTLTGQCRTQDTTEGLLLDNVSLVVAVGENVSLNRGPTGTKIPHTLMVERVARILHGSQIDGNHIITFNDFSIISAQERGVMLYQVRFATSALLTETGD